MGEKYLSLRGSLVLGAEGDGLAAGAAVGVEGQKGIAPSFLVWDS